MPTNLLDLIKATKTFSSLDTEASQFILTKCVSVEIEANHILFHQGDAPDSVYIVISGRLAAETILSHGEVKQLGYIEPGETVGELGVLSNEVRTLSIRALRDSKLFRISAADFTVICRRYPAVLFATINPIVTRANNIIQMLSAGKDEKNIAIFPAGKNVSLAHFTMNLLASAKQYQSLICITDQLPEIADLNTVDAVRSKIQEMVKDTKKNTKLLFIINSFRHPLAKIAVKSADMIYVATDTINKKIDEGIFDKIHKRRSHMRVDPALIIIHPEDAETPTNTADWLAQGTFSLHHHLRLNNDRDFRRLLRFIRGRAVGVVLSGGGTRGWAHLGVLQALRKSKVPIDMIGGTSAGGIVAACYVTSKNFIEMRKKIENIISMSNHSLAWRNLTWPIISLFNAKNWTNALKDTLPNVRIENFWIPYFCVSCNLAKNIETVHRTGLVWEALRASSSIPGLIPPMVINGDLHVDGGLLNNLPTDIMRNYLGPRARVIAVELNSFAPQPGSYDFPPTMMFKDAFFSRFGWSMESYRFPNFVDTFLKAMFIGSLSKSRNHGLLASTLISLELSNYRLLFSKPREAEEMIKIGFKEAIKQLKK